MKADRLQVPGVPRWVARVTLGNGGINPAGDHVVTMTCQVRPWRMRAWLAWRLLTARFTREVS